MLYDELHIPVRRDECERVTNDFVVNGYFYILYYKATSSGAIKDGYDRAPVIYCFAPDENEINNFWGINFHYFRKPVQEYILKQMIDYYDITNGFNKRVILDASALNAIYTNIGIGARRYSRKNIKDVYRIKNKFIPKYMEVSPQFMITTQQKVESDFDLAPGNKGF
jgi:hypothetical protein